MKQLGLLFMAILLLFFVAYGLWFWQRAVSLSFEQPLFLLLLLPFLALWVRQYFYDKPARLMFPTASLAASLPMSGAILIRPMVRLVGLLGVCCCVFALARPMGKPSAQNAFAEGIDIVFALDISGSMEAADFKPNNRLFVAKSVLKEVIEQRKTDRLGLVVFAGEAYTQVPLTLDYQVLVNLLTDVRTGVVADGTAIGDALGTAINRLRTQGGKTKVIILLTDGDNNAGALPPLEAAQLAQSLGIKVYTILIGREGKVPFPQGRDIFGNIIYADALIAINPQLMKQIAEMTQALSFRAEDSISLKRGLHQALDHLEKNKIEAPKNTQKEELFWELLLVGMLGIFIEWGLLRTRLAMAL